MEIPATTDTFVVLKTHNLTRDKEWAQRFLPTPDPYLGLLGPQGRCEADSYTTLPLPPLNTE